tara:strand:+ start:774 stop:4880 length:4107 start_codon:yes stop_codon:yes gene_type:complete
MESYFAEFPNLASIHNTMSYDDFLKKINLVFDKYTLSVTKIDDKSVPPIKYGLEAEFKFNGRFESSGKTPVECRRENKTYGGELYTDLIVRTSQYLADGTVDMKEHKFIGDNSIKIATLPIMVQSSECLSVKNRIGENLSESLVKLGECRHDLGGYFIIDGKEKVIVTQEQLAYNRIHIYSTNSDEIDVYDEKNFITDDINTDDLLTGSKNTKEFGYITETKVHSKSGNKQNYYWIADIRSYDPKSTAPPQKTSLRYRKDDTFQLEIPFVRIEIPVIAMFRALGYESDKEIMELIFQKDFFEMERESNKFDIIFTEKNNRLYSVGNDYIPFVFNNGKSKENCEWKIDKFLSREKNINKNTISYKIRFVDNENRKRSVIVSNNFLNKIPEIKSKLLTIDQLFVYRSMFEKLRPSIYEVEGLYTQELALHYIASFTKVPPNKLYDNYWKPNLYDIISNRFLPHVNNELHSKALFLGHMTKQLLYSIIGLQSGTDRDSLVSRRFQTPGFLLTGIFRESFTQMIDAAKRNINNMFAYTKAYRNENFHNIIDDVSVRRIFNDVLITKAINTSFKGKWGKQKKEGIVQDLNRLSYLGTLSHIRRIRYCIGAPNLIGPRKLHPSQYGYICPNDTPDGGNIGQVKHFTIGSFISGLLSEKQEDYIKTLLKRLGVINNLAYKYKNLNAVAKIFLNGNLFGVHDKPYKLVDTLRSLRRTKWKSFRLKLISISWSISLMEIYINMDEGRVLRPLYVAKSNINFDIKKGYNWVEMVNAGIIEYIDVEESENTYIATDMENYKKNVNSYTHIEIDPTFAVSALMAINPFMKNNAAPRQLFSAVHLKQAVSVYTTNFRLRLDQSANVLNTGQMPLCQTRFSKCLSNNDCVYGFNVIILIGCLDGYNQEDAIIMNKQSVQRGLFNSTYYSTYQFQETKESAFNAQTFIGHPKKFEAVLASDNKNYDYLDENGIIRVGSPVNENTVLIGAVSYSIDKYNNISVVPKHMPEYEEMELSPLEKTHIKSVFSKYSNNKEESGILNFETLKLALNSMDMYPSNTSIRIILIRLNIKNNEIYLKKFIQVITNIYKEQNPYNGIVERVYLESDASLLNNEKDKNNDNIKKNKARGNEDLKTAKVVIRKTRIPILGDKFTSRASQKGTIGFLIDETEMPYNKDGIVADIIMNPHSFPTRNTPGHLMDIAYSKIACRKGSIFTNDQNTSLDYNKISMEAKKYDTNIDGDIFYDPHTGRVMNEGKVMFNGPIFYIRLKQQVDDKIQSRAEGPVSYLTKQPSQGRANDGGMRKGEMERDVLLSHGISQYAKEAFFNRSDVYKCSIDSKHGTLHVPSSNNDSFTVNIPYSFKLLMQEIQSLGMTMRLINHNSRGL